MVRRGARAFVAVATALAFATSGCSFLFVRKPTPEGARAPGSCEGRGIAAGADAVLAGFAAYRLAAPGSTLLAVNPIRSSGVTLYESQPWLVRNSYVIWLPVLLVELTSMTYGISRTSECIELRTNSPQELLPGGAAVPRPNAPSLRAAPTGPSPRPPEAVAPVAPAPPAPAPPVPQQTDSE
jgi:hypothetical protein